MCILNKKTPLVFYKILVDIFSNKTGLKVLYIKMVKTIPLLTLHCLHGPTTLQR